MKRTAFLLFLVLLSPLPAVSTEFSDYYTIINGSLSITGDVNTGTTVFPLLRIPPGGKAEGMGTAQTAVAADASSVMFNPAASSLLDLTELSFIHNNWIADSSIESVIFTRRLDDLGIGAGATVLYLPFTKYDSWGESTASGYPLEAVLSLNASYNMFHSYEFNGISAGLSLKTAYRHIPSSIYGNQSSLAVIADAGLLAELDLFKFYSSRDPNMALGVAFRNLGIETLGEPLPAEFAAGISYSPLRPLNLAFDFILPVNMDPSLPAEKWYLAAGLNAVFTDFFSVQAGFNYRGANPRISIGSDINLEAVAFTLNYMLDLTTSSDSLDRFSIAARLKLGDEGRFENAARVDELYIAGLEAYATGNVEKAIAYWKAALEIDSSFTPAEKFLAGATRSMELLERMEELNRVE